MRILLAGDTHGNTGHLRLLLDVAAQHGVDRIVQVGDFGYWEHTADGGRFLDEVHRSARSRGVTVYFIDGNHDNAAHLLKTYAGKRDGEGFVPVRTRVRYAPRGHRWTWGSTRFLAFGGALSLDKEFRLEDEERLRKKAERKEQYRLTAGRPPEPIPEFAGMLWFPGEEATEEETAAVLADPSPVDVLLTHDKPRKANPSWNRKDLPECHPNQERIQRLVDTFNPAVAVHGHLHFRYTEELPNGTRVEGLGADPAASYEVKGYRTQDSWMLLDCWDPTAMTTTM